MNDFKTGAVFATRGHLNLRTKKGKVVNIPREAQKIKKVSKLIRSNTLLYCD